MLCNTRGYQNAAYGNASLRRMIAGMPDPAHCAVAVAVLRGVGAAIEKSLELLPVMLQPPLLRIAAVVLEIAEAGFGQFAVPVPTRSRTLAPVGHVPESTAVAFESATFVLLPDMAVVPVASGVGNGVVPPVPAACWTR